MQFKTILNAVNVCIYEGRRPHLFFEHIRVAYIQEYEFDHSNQTEIWISHACLALRKKHFGHDV